MAYLVFDSEAAAFTASTKIAENLGIDFWYDIGILEDGGFFLPQPEQSAMIDIENYFLSVTVRPLGAPAPSPDSVTNTQTRLLLLSMPGRNGGSSLFAEVDAALKSGGSQTPAFQIWEYNNNVFRNDDLVLSIAVNFGFTSEEIDEMFRQASAL